jgi:RNA polymerase sigma-70 factor (ECF subfamily)
MPADSSLDIRLLTAAIPRDAGKQRLEEEVTGLFEQWRAALLRYLSTFGLRQQDSEEIVQEVFLALFSHLQKKKAQTNLRAWLFRVAHNLALKRRNTESRVMETTMDASEVPDGALNPEEELALNRQQRQFRCIFGALPEQDRRCLCLRAEGLRYREIAGVMGISLGSVALSLERSLGRFQRAGGR